MILCWLGFHSWLYIPLKEGEERQCQMCEKRQKAHLYEFCGFYYVKWRTIKWDY